LIIDLSGPAVAGAGMTAACYLDTMLCICHLN
jgi:hypothetical protein